MLKFSGMYVKGHGQGQTFLYEQKGLITRNAHFRYGSPTSIGSKVMVKVYVFVTDERTLMRFIQLKKGRAS